MQQRRRISAVRQRPTLAIMLSVALVASGLAAASSQIIRTQDEGIGPVDVMNQSTSFSSGSNIVVDDPAIMGQGEEPGPRTVKEFQREEPFSMFALTWKGQRDVTAFVRAEKEDGTWTEWLDMEPLAIEDTDPNSTQGTDLIFHGSTNKIQVSTHNVDLFGDDAGAAATDGTGGAIPEAAPEAAPVAEYAAEAIEEAPLEAPVDTPIVEEPVIQAPAEAPVAAPVEVAPAAPADNGLAPLPSNYGDIQPVAEVASDLDAVFIDGNAEAGVGGVDLMADTDGMPRVISRAGWGANESLRCRQPTIDDGVSAITIHHTAGINDYTRAESAGRMRGYYTYHAQTLGWCDIGYQALVDKYGTIYEGRAGGLNRAVQGAHAGGFNQNTWAISMMGNYQNFTPPEAMIQSVGELAGWRAKVAGFDPTGRDTHYSEGSSYTTVPYGQAINLPNIFAHRDVGNTSCPGNAGYAQMDNIRSIAKAKYDSILNEDAAGDAAPTTTAVASPTESATDTPAATPTDSASATATAEPAPQDTTTTEPAPQDTVTITEEPAPQAGSGSSELDMLNQVLTGGSSGSSELLNGADGAQVLTGIGSILAVIIGLAATDGDLGALLGNLGNNNGVPTLDNINLDDVVPVVDTVINLAGDNEYSRTWNDLNNLLGPVLGAATGGETTVRYASEENSEVSFVPFENGIMVSSPEAGTHGLWGVIGDTWAQQGADLGPLGLPLNHEYREGNLLRVDFQGGYITFDPATAKVDIQLT